MTSLIEAINATETYTTNGMPTYSSSMSNLVDLFFNVGASRGKDIIPAFSKAFNTNAELAVRIALWARDVRGGSGERQLFKDMMAYLVTKDVEMARRVIKMIPELGRWDDLYVFFGTPLERDALRLIAAALNDGNGLCSKWMDRKGPHANKVRAYMQKTPKQYRKMLVELTNVVETAMCQNKWTSIEFGKLPSLASARYQKAFGRHAPAEYQAYINALEQGEAKINADAVYPYDVIKSLRSGNAKVADAQWKALPNYLEGSDENILPLVDTSGSMSTAYIGNNRSITCLDVAVSLGLYLSELSEGKFKDAFITFSERPKLQIVTGSLKDRYDQMSTASWQMNTDLEAAFSLILDAGVKYNIPQSEMPTTLLILSDMQFDRCMEDPSQKVMDMIESKYEKAGYKRPKVIFWNLNASGTSPITFNRSGTALVSGFSPAIMGSVLKCENITPEHVMLETIMKDRYTF